MNDSAAGSSTTVGAAKGEGAAAGGLKTPARPVCNNADLQSPLRYPGGKRQLVPFFVEILKLNGLTPLELFVEPFAGGAAVSLHLLASDAVENVILAEHDPLVYAFWHQACFNTASLIDDILNAEVSLEEWQRLRDNPGKSLREMAYACIFLNRTSYSGILHPRAGPIGGQRQSSSYKIECRFPKQELASRISRVGALAAEGRILRVIPHDVEVTIWEVEESFRHTERLYYLDPPFYDKGSRLYRLPFGQRDHERLACLLTSFGEPWVLSYDYHDEILALYTPDPVAGSVGSHQLHATQLQYGNRHRQKDATELIVTNLPSVPEAHVRPAGR
jgi:DNA adenine methylase